MSTAALRKELASFKSKYSLAKPLKGKKSASQTKQMSRGQRARKKRQEKKQRETEGYLDNTPYHKLTPVERRRLELRYADKLESNMAIIQRQARMAKKTADDVKVAQDKILESMGKGTGKDEGQNDDLSDDDDLGLW